VFQFSDVTQYVDMRSYKNMSYKNPSFADVTQNVDKHRYKNSRLQETIEAAVHDPIATPPQSTLG